MEENNLIKQNCLLKQKKFSLEEKIKSLENENRILHNILSAHSLNVSQHEEYVDNIWQDEMRYGFFVSSTRKRLWNSQIGILKEFANICKKYNLNWFAHGDTLLGAVCHKGFIPWGFDTTVAMLRPDYEKFRRIVAQELKSPYFFEPWYNHTLKTDIVSDIKDDEDFPMIPFQTQMISLTTWPFFPKLRIKDTRTTMILDENFKEIPQNIFIDIVPLDPVPPFADKNFEKTFESAKFLYLGTITPWRIKHFLNKGQPLIFSREMAENFLKLPFRKRALIRENFMAENFFESEYVTELRTYIFRDKDIHSDYLFPTKDFKGTIYLPFEKFQIPVPAGYEHILNATYKDWHEINEFRVDRVELPYCSTDIPYEEYAKTSIHMNNSDTATH